MTTWKDVADDILKYGLVDDCGTIWLDSGVQSQVIGHVKGGKNGN